MSDEKEDKKEEIEGEIVPYTNPKDLAEFIQQPNLKIAEAITGGLAIGSKGLAQAAGRIVQGAIKGKGMQQFSKELRKLSKEGKIKDDYANNKHGFQSFCELLDFIDSEAPDDERLRAVKAMFFNLISVDSNAGEETLNYKLFLLSKQLKATQLAILDSVYKIFLRHPDGFSGLADEWFKEVASTMGHGVKSLVESEEKALEDFKLISSRIHSDRSGINPQNCRLTDLGIKFCEKMVEYDKAIK